MDFMVMSVCLLPQENLMDIFLWYYIVHIILKMSSKGIAFFIGLVS